MRCVPQAQGLSRRPSAASRRGNSCCVATQPHAPAGPARHPRWRAARTSAAHNLHLGLFCWCSVAAREPLVATAPVSAALVVLRCAAAHARVTLCQNKNDELPCQLGLLGSVCGVQGGVPAASFPVCFASKTQRLDGALETAWCTTCCRTRGAGAAPLRAARARVSFCNRGTCRFAREARLPYRPACWGRPRVRCLRPRVRCFLHQGRNG